MKEPNEHVDLSEQCKALWADLNLIFEHYNQWYDAAGDDPDHGPSLQAAIEHIDGAMTLLAQYHGKHHEGVIVAIERNAKKETEL